jgi:hypothetical protein
MKTKQFFTTLVLLMVVIVANAQTKLLPFEQGTYVEVLEADGIETREIIFFKRWGEWKSKETELVFSSGDSNIIVKIPLITIQKGDTSWSINLAENTGTRTIKSFVPTLFQPSNQNNQPNNATQAPHSPNRGTTTDLGEETYLGSFLQHRIGH